MIERAAPRKSISVSEFKARCTEQLRAVEEQGVSLDITRHGKVVATVRPSESDGPTMAEWIGSGAGSMEMSKETLASFDQPTWSDDEWFTDDEDNAGKS